MSAIRIEIWLSAAYAVFLLAVAACLERVARHCHRRSHRIHTAGFRFRQELDVWECPTGQFLTRAGSEPGDKLAIYRAPARACNGCHRKAECTHSERGREIAAPAGSWLQSHVGRFHRGLSLSLNVLAGLLLVVELFRSQDFTERSLLAAVLVWITISAKRQLSELRAG